MSEIGELLTSNIPDSYRTGSELASGVKITGAIALGWKSEPKPE